MVLLFFLQAFGEAISELRQYDQGAHGGYFR
jgi:hypothetical protein